MNEELLLNQPQREEEEEEEEEEETDENHPTTSNRNSSSSRVNCETAYENCSSPGLCIILTQTKFNSNLNLPERCGADVDKRNLVSLFQDTLNFIVITFDDNNREDILKRLNEVKSKHDLESLSCLVVVMMSHGTKEEISARDISFKESDLIIPFLWENSPKLINKPKLFFLQKCRGCEVDEGVEVSSGKEDHHDLYYVCEPGTYSSSADILVAYPSTKGKMAHRREESGSLFIETLCRVFKANFHEHDVVSMLTLVNKLISEKFESKIQSPSQKRKKQMPCFRSQMRHKLYLSRDSMPVAIETMPEEGYIQISRQELINCSEKYSTNSCGLCIILNQKDILFDSPENDKDVDLLKNLFGEKLGFATYVWTNVTVCGIRQIWNEKAVKDSFKKATCLVIFILSHGKGNKFVGYDKIDMGDYEVSIDKIVSFVNGENCPDLANKPKLFFIQASPKLPKSTKNSWNSSSCAQMQDENTIDQHDNLPPMKTLPMEANILMAYSSVPGTKNAGSPFICALSEVFGSMHSKWDVVSMLTSVNLLMTEELSSQSNDDSSSQRMPFFESRLTRKLFLTSKYNEKIIPYTWRKKFSKDFQSILKWAKPEVTNYEINQIRCLLLCDYEDFLQYKNKVRETFEELDFDVVEANENTEEFVKQQRDNPDVYNVSCFVMVILSQKGSLKDSWNFFSDSECIGLKGKPKVCIRLIVDDSQSISFGPSINDFLFLTIRVPDDKTCQSNVIQSFIEILCDILQTHHEVEDVENLFNMVRSKVIREQKGEQKYIPLINSCLTKKLYFINKK